MKATRYITEVETQVGTVAETHADGTIDLVDDSGAIIVRRVPVSTEPLPGHAVIASQADKPAPAAKGKKS